jgi:two-component system, NtrC family, response regulator AtoC
LIEGILFGHERGAFSGADRQSRGIFEHAQGGTVFLDEVAELSPAAQTALLRVLEQRQLVRVGGSREIDIDVRIVAATHADLDALVASKAFRADLHYRLDVLTLEVPPLRERSEEILPLASRFFALARAEWDGSARAISRAAQDALLAYSWPGNVRELKNVIDRAVVICEAPEIGLGDLPDHVIGRPPLRDTTDDAPMTIDATQALPLKVRAFEIACITRALEECAGNRSHAARLLGLPRKTLTNKIQVYGLERAG